MPLEYICFIRSYINRAKYELICSLQNVHSEKNRASFTFFYNIRLLQWYVGLFLALNEHFCIVKKMVEIWKDAERLKNN